MEVELLGRFFPRKNMSLKTRAQWLSWAEAELKSAATPQPRAEAEFLLAAALQSSRQ